MSKSEGTVREVYVKAFQPNSTMMVTTDADINNMEDPSLSTDSEFEEYATPPAGRNEIQQYQFEPTVERDEDSTSENVSRDDNSIYILFSQLAENIIAHLLLCSLQTSTLACKSRFPGRYI